MELKFRWPQVVRPPNHSPGNYALYTILALAAVAAITHALLAKNPAALYSLAVLAVKAVLVHRGVRVTPRWLVLPLTATGLGLVFFQFGGLLGQYAGFALLVILLALKLLESKRLGDYQLACLLMYFIAAGQFLYHFSFVAIAAIIAYCVAVTGALHMLSVPGRTHARGASWLAFGMLVKAIPLAVLLFLFFPRISADFGFLPGNDTGSETLSNTLSPGEISGAAFSDERVFRVTFETPRPPVEQLYWRVKIMTVEEEFGWRLDLQHRWNWETMNPVDVRPDAAGAVRYSILHDPTLDRLLPTLAYAQQSDFGLLLANHSLRDTRPPGRRISYSAVSTQASGEAGPRDPDAYLQTSFEPENRTAALLNRWRSQTGDPEQLARLILQYFNQQPFAYSLLPPELGKRPMEEFLFDTRTGYCEHYASAFTLLMRWAGVPARVVTGYQGGEWNPTGNYLTVRYSDAHAWSEIWTGRRWLRVDPTFAIAPERIEFGIDAVRRLWQAGRLGQGMNAAALSDFLRPGRLRQTWRTALQYWNSAEFKWTTWIMRFDEQAQRRMLQAMGLSTSHVARNLVLLLTAGCGLLTLVYLLWVLPRPTRQHPVERVYRRFLNEMGRAGVRRAPAEGPVDFARRAAEALPAKRAAIDGITRYYVRFRYGDGNVDADSMAASLRTI